LATGHIAVSDMVELTKKSPTPPDVAKTLRQAAAHIKDGERSDHKAFEYYRKAGLLLLKIRQRCNSGGFEALCKKYCNISRSRANELIAIATGKKTLEQIRAENAKRQAELQQRRKAAVEIVEAAAPASAVTNGDCSNVVSLDERRPSSAKATLLAAFHASWPQMSPADRADFVALVNRLLKKAVGQ